MSGYKATDVQFPTFCDASEASYGSVALNYTLVQRFSWLILNKKSLPDIKILSPLSLEVNTAVIGAHLCKLLIKK